MDQLSSILHKNENNTDIPLYHIYLPKLHILKHYRLNLFKEIAIGLHHNLQLESPATLSDSPIIEICKYCTYHCLLFIFGVSQSFVGFSLNRAPHIIIKEIAIWKVRQPDIRGDVITEIFWQPRLGSSACVVIHRILLLNRGSSRSRPLDLGQYYLPGHLMLTLRACEKMNRGISPSLETTPNVMMWIECMVFINVNTSYEYRVSKQLFCNLPTGPWQKFFSSEKKQSMFLATDRINLLGSL